MGHAPSAVFANDYRVDRRRPATSPHPGSFSLVARTAARKRHHLESELLPRYLSSVLLGAIFSDLAVGGAAASIARPFSINFLDVRQCRLCRLIYRTAHFDLDSRADPRRCRGAWRFAR